MAVNLTFWGSALTKLRGERGGVQIILEDTVRKTKIGIDFGDRIERREEMFGFPEKESAYSRLLFSYFHKLMPPIPDLYRHDWREHRGDHDIGPPPLDAILFTHGHYDHTGAITALRYDQRLVMNPSTIKMLDIWQQTSGATNNQFINLIWQLARSTKMYGGEKYISGEVAVQPREIMIYHPLEQFQVGGLTVTAYPVDHSHVDACGFIIDTSVGKIAFSGDLRYRGRRGENTERFVQAIMDQNVKYLIWEGSLLDFDHNGTEEDVTSKTAELLQGRTFASFACAPRDLDRLASLHEAARLTDRMMVINMTMAQYLRVFGGEYGLPRLDDEHIGVLVQPIKKGTILNPELTWTNDRELIEKDYAPWKRQFLDFPRWNGHEEKCQQVRLSDIKEYPDKFYLYMTLNDTDGFLTELCDSQGKMPKDSIYIRHHPAPYMDDMFIDERRHIHLLDRAGIYEGSKADYLTPVNRGKPNIKKMHTIHMTGHFNKEENIAIFERFRQRIPNLTVIPNHTNSPTRLYKNEVAREFNVMVPEYGKTMVLA